MKKNLKKIIGIAFCLILCIALLTSCTSGLYRYNDSPEDLALRYQELGYSTEIIHGDFFNGNTIGGTDSSSEFVGIELAVIVEDKNDSSNYGYFFFCTDPDSAEENYNNLYDYMNNSSSHEALETLIHSENIVYVGAEEIISEIYSDSENTSVLAMLGTVLAGSSILLIAVVVVVLLSVVICLILSVAAFIIRVAHVFITLVLFILVIVLACVSASRKKKIKRLYRTIEKQ